MARKYTVGGGNSSQTTEATLAALAAHIAQFVQEGTLDSRCAVKLARRLRKEADAITTDSGQTKDDQHALRRSFDELDEAVRQHDAALLVAANAARRVGERAPARRVK
jgi:hypothetical protein